MRITFNFVELRHFLCWNCAAFIVYGLSEMFQATKKTHWLFDKIQNIVKWEKLLQIVWFGIL